MTRIKTIGTKDLKNNLSACLAEWIESGVVRPAAGKKSPLPVSPVRMKESAAVNLLDADRRERA